MIAYDVEDDFHLRRSCACATTGTEGCEISKVWVGAGRGSWLPASRGSRLGRRRHHLHVLHVETWWGSTVSCRRAASRVIKVVVDAFPVAALILPERTRLDVVVVVDVAVGEAIDDELIDGDLCSRQSCTWVPSGLGVGAVRALRTQPTSGTSALRDASEITVDAPKTKLKHDVLLLHGYELELNHHSTPRPDELFDLALRENIVGRIERAGTGVARGDGVEEPELGPLVRPTTRGGRKVE